MVSPADLLAQTPLFGALPQQHREQIAARFTRHEIAPNTSIVRQGEPADALFLIEAGLVGVFVKDPRLNVVRLVNQLAAPESFGEMGLIEQAPRSATVQSDSDVTLLVLDRAGMRRLTEESPRAAAAFFHALVQVFIERLRASGDLVAEVTRWGLEATGLDLDAR